MMSQEDMLYVLTCEPPIQHPENGVTLCSDQNNLGSECVFYCNIGYKAVGARMVKCCNDRYNYRRGKWTNLPPKCYRKKH